MTKRRSYRKGITPASCPRCGYHLGAATMISAGKDARPKPGDFSLCLRCGQILRFDHELQPVLALEHELAELTPEALAVLRRAQRLAPLAWKKNTP